MSEAACQATGEAATVHCRACRYYSSMLRPFLQHIEAFFGQEIREISCKAIFDFSVGLQDSRDSARFNRTRAYATLILFS